MKWWMCAIHDGAAKAWLQPFCVRHQGEARRHFSNSVNGTRDSSMMAAAPADFTLFAVGSYDDETGKIESIEPVSLGNGVTYKQVPQE